MWSRDAFNALSGLARFSPEEQRTRREEIVETFRQFWADAPDENDFQCATDGLILFPEILYIMSTVPCGKRYADDG